MAPAPAAPQSPPRVSRPSGGPHLLRAAKQQWRSIGPLLRDTALYLDAGAAEAVAAGVGVSYLLGVSLAVTHSQRSQRPELLIDYTLFCTFSEKT